MDGSAVSSSVCCVLAAFSVSASLAVPCWSVHRQVPGLARAISATEGLCCRPAGSETQSWLAFSNAIWARSREACLLPACCPARGTLHRGTRIYRQPWMKREDVNLKKNKEQLGGKRFKIKADKRVWRWQTRRWLFEGVDRLLTQLVGLQLPLSQTHSFQKLSYLSSSKTLLNNNYKACVAYLLNFFLHILYCLQSKLESYILLLCVFVSVEILLKHLLYS